MVLLDGKKLSQKILDEVRKKVSETASKLRLAVVMAGENAVIKKFVEQKKKIADSVGIGVKIYMFPATVTTNELRKKLAEIVHEKKNTGVIVQLPLPDHINTQYILNSVTPEIDVDMLSSRALGNFVAGKSPIISPVAGAGRAFLGGYNIFFREEHVVVAGLGNLVGRPVALWLLSERATFSVVTKDTPDVFSFFKTADIVISGMGQPNFIKGDMVKEGVVIIDAGTSESGGRLVGDVEFASVAPKTSCITPVPGGVGPVAIAMLLKNLVTLAGQKPFRSGTAT